MANRNELKWTNAIAPEAANKVPAWNGSGLPVIVDPLTGDAADIAVTARGIWEYQSLTTTPVADGKVRFNSTTIASITVMNIAQTTDEGTDAGFLFATLKAGDDIYFQLRADATKWVRFRIAATPVDNGAWWAMPVTVVGSGGALPGSATKCIVRFTAANAATDYFKGSYASLGALNTAVPTAAAGDYALVDVAASPAQLYIWDPTDSAWVASGVTVTASNGLTKTGSNIKLGGNLIDNTIINLDAIGSYFNLTPDFAVGDDSTLDIYIEDTFGYNSNITMGAGYIQLTQIGEPGESATIDLTSPSVEITAVQGNITLNATFELNLVANVFRLNGVNAVTPTTMFFRGDGTWAVPAGGGGGGHVIEDEGTPLTQRANLNFVGTGVSVADAGGKTVVTIAGSSGGHVIEDEGVPLAQQTILNFVGAGVAVTDVGGKTVVTITGGSTGGGLTSVGLVLGTTGTDITVTGSPLLVDGDITLNIPNASATARGVVTTAAQTFAGVKTFSSTPTFSTMTAKSVFFAGAGGVLTQDNANFGYDSGATPGQLLLGTTGTSSFVRINSSWSNDSTSYGILHTNSNTGTQAAAVLSVTTGGGNRGYFQQTGINFTANTGAGIKPLQVQLNSLGAGGLLLADLTGTSGIGFRITTVLTAIITSAGLGIGVNPPTARLHIAAGTATASTAPIKLVTGVALTTPEDGVVEYHGSHLWFTIGSTRFQLDQQSGGGGVTLAAIGSTPNANAATLTGSVLNLEPASASFGGIITTAAQTFAGAKTFNDIIASPGLGIGVAATTNRVIHISKADAVGVQVYVINTDTGAASTTSVVVNNGTSSGAMIMYGTGTATASLFSVLGGGAGGMTVGAAHASGVFTMQAGGSERARISSTGLVGIGITNPTARLHLPAGTAAVNTAPLKLTSGTALSTPENGAIEYDNDHLWFTSSSSRRQLDQQGGGNGTANQVLGMDNSGSITEWKTISLGTTAQSNNLGWVLTGSQTIVLHVPDASGTVRGVMTTGSQSFAGAKTFTTSVAITGMTTGSVLFYSGTITQNNAQLFWSTASTALCIGTTTPLHKVTVESSADAFTGLSVANPNTGVNAKAGIHFSTGGLNIQVGILGANTVTSGNKRAGQLEFNLGSGGGMHVLTTNTVSTVTVCTNNDNSNTRLHIGHTGVGIGTPASVGGVLTPTAALHLPAGAAAAGSAPLKFITGTAMTTPEDGALEYHTSHLYFTIGSTRFQLDQQGGGGAPAGSTTAIQINNAGAFGASAVYLPSAGNVTLGDTGLSGDRTIQAINTAGNAVLNFVTQGGNFVIGGLSSSSGTVTIAQNASGTTKQVLLLRYGGQGIGNTPAYTFDTPTSAAFNGSANPQYLVKLNTNITGQTGTSSFYALQSVLATSGRTSTGEVYHASFEISGLGSLMRIQRDGVLEFSSGIAAPAAAAGVAKIYADVSVDTTTSLAFQLNQAVEAIGTFTPSHKLKIKINDVWYWIQLDAV